MKTKTYIFMLFLAAATMGIGWLASTRHRLVYRRQVLEKEIIRLNDSSQYLLLKEDSVDSLMYHTDSLYRVSIIKEAQKRIIWSDTLLNEANIRQREFDSIEGVLKK